MTQQTQGNINVHLTKIKVSQRYLSVYKARYNFLISDSSNSDQDLLNWFFDLLIILLLKEVF